MTPSPRLPALLLALLLAAPAPGQAAPTGSVGEVAAASAFATDATGSGPLVAAAFYDAQGKANPSIRGSADWVEVRVEAEKVTGKLNTSVERGLGASEPRDPVVERRSNATLATSWPAQPHEAALFPLPGAPAPSLSLASHCLGVEPAQPQGLQPTPHVSTPTTPHPAASLGGSHALRPCASDRLRIEGDFLLVLWGADLRVRDAAGTTEAWSGSRPDPADPGLLPPYVQNEREQEIFLTVRGGSLSLSWGLPDAAHIYAAGLRVQAPALSLQDAHGTLRDGAGPRRVDARQLDLQGDLSAAFGPLKDGALSLELGGTVASGALDGQALAWVVAAEPRAFRWGLLLLVAGSVALPAGGLASHRAWSRRSLESLEALLAARRDDAVVRRSRALVRWSPFRTEALLLRIEALLRQGKAGQAFEDLRELPPAVRDGPMGQFLRGHILAAAGQPRMGAVVLAHAAGAGPEFRARIAGDPLYLDARGEDALRSALAGGRP
ncbi:MAG: hypothetical protein LC623_06530 [Halobacteriales archaeon]|nr:hypothetical protein [Halobacteriales archaeon]